MATTAILRSGVEERPTSTSKKETTDDEEDFYEEYEGADCEDDNLEDGAIDEEALSMPLSMPPPPVRREWLSELLKRHESPRTPLDLRGKALAVAPMVDQSDLPFRLLCRRYGANLAYTPMIHARLFVQRPAYRNKFWKMVEGMPAADRPLIAQFCSSEPYYLIRAAQMIAPHVDAVDLNCGCPQNIAKRGNYGAFLLEDADLLVRVVGQLVRTVGREVPVCVKVRLLPGGIEESLTLYRRLVSESGISLLAVHGRNRFQKGPRTGQADWGAIRRVVDELGRAIPILANGSIANLDDVRRCLEETGADGVLSSEAILEYPALFCDAETNTAATGGKRTGPSRITLSQEYLDLCRTYPPNQGGQGSGVKCMRVHVHRMLHADLQKDFEFRDAVAFHCFSFQELLEVVDRMQEKQRVTQHVVHDEQLSWYMRHRHLQGGNQSEKEPRAAPPTLLEEEDGAGCMAAMFGDDDDDDGEVCACSD